MEFIPLIMFAAFVVWVISILKRKQIDLSCVPSEFVVIDTETTGLDPMKHEIIEIGAIKVHKDSSNHDTFQALIKPTKKITPKITSINGITNEMVDKDGIQLKDALEGLRQFIDGFPVVAYNADFDKMFINVAAERAGMKQIIKKPTCALKLARKAWHGLNSYKLTELARMTGQDTDGMHRALSDCRMTAIVYMAALPIVKAKYGGR